MQTAPVRYGAFCQGEMDPVPMEKSISLQTKKGKWSVSLSTPAYCSDDLGGDEVIPEPRLCLSLCLWILESSFPQLSPYLLYFPKFYDMVPPLSALQVMGFPPLPSFHGLHLKNTNMENQHYPYPDHLRICCLYSAPPSVPSLFL